jgi:hypothetical protein
METEPLWPSSNATRPNGSGSVFGCGVKATQLRHSDVAWLRDDPGIGQVQAGHGCWEWLVKDQSQAQWLLRAIRPFARVTAPQVDLALQILEHRVESVEDLRELAEMADALSLLNVRSRGRRQNDGGNDPGFRLP